MKKSIKILTTVLMVVAIIATISSTVFGSSIIDQFSGDLTANAKGASNVTNLGKSVVGILQVIGIIIAVVVLLVLGIKYMMGSAEEKAEYKKTMIPYLVGALLIFAATTIVSVVYNLFSGISA